VAQSILPPAPGLFRTNRDRLQRAPGLPFLDHLAPELVEAACRGRGHRWRHRVYTPWVTLGLFLSQVLNADGSCDDAVDRFQKYRHRRGLPRVSTKTAGYCEARGRLPEGAVWDLVRATGGAAHRAAEAAWHFHGRPVKVVDGTTVLLPDTPANQAAYPQPKTQEPGLGFPVARLVVVFSLAVGTVLEAAIGPYQGKQTSELALLRTVVDRFRPGDVFLADRFFCSYWVIADLLARGVDVVVRLHQRRTADFRRGRRLGREDHRVTWPKPEQVPDWMSRAEYDAMPAAITVRELRVRVRDRSKRVRRLVVVTTLLDPRAYPAEGVGGLFRRRWDAELNLRTLKTDMDMEMLRTKTPGMARKEVAAHLLAYNLIRGVMAEAARASAVPPRRLSFMGALHTVRAFEEEHLYDPERVAADLPLLIELVAEKRLVDRPDRYEPRAVKRRPKPYPLLKRPRPKARRLIAQGRDPHDKKIYKRARAGASRKKRGR
jgi:putative transposase